jgi:serine/threonine-protein kinase
MGEPATPLSDIYSLDVVAYQCLTGYRPFDGDNPLEIAMRHVREQAPPFPPDVPPAARAITERAMAKRAADRWPNAAAFAQEARRAAIQLGVSVVQPAMVAAGGSRPAPAPVPPPGITRPLLSPAGEYAGHSGQLAAVRPPRRGPTAGTLVAIIVAVVLVAIAVGAAVAYMQLGGQGTP